MDAGCGSPARPAPEAAARRRRRPPAPRAAAALATLAALVCLAADPAPTLRGDPFRGRELLAAKLCTRCHAVWSHGGVLGPDMSAVVAGKSWPDLVGDFWNHTPRMIDAMVNEGYGWPTLDRTEMADLLSYLYYLRLFDEPGDPGRGAIAFSQFRCAACHSLGGKDGSLGGSLDRFSAYPAAVVLAQAMWNAGPTMQKAQIRLGTPIPNFSGNEMADIQAFIRSQGLRGDRGVELLSLPDPTRGERVFRSKNCSTCHTRASREAPDLSRSALSTSASEISGVLWNHSYAMHDRMAARGIPFPRFEGGEMSDLISYLYFLSFVGKQGDPRRGEALFRERGCAGCHGAPDGKAPDLSASATAADPVVLSAAMWNHAPEMHRLMAERSVAWPKFERGDMENLAAYLREVSTTRTDVR